MRINALIICMLTFSLSAYAEENRGEVRERIEPNGFLYGFGLGINQEIYKGYDYRVIPLPLLGYRSENLRILGPFISFDTLQISDIEITLLAAPRFQGFDDSDSFVFENMAERAFSMDVGFGATYEKNNWRISTSAMFDVLGRSNGYEAKGNISRVFRRGPIFIEPSLSVSFLDSKHVDYYYGVKAHEINQFTYQYEGESAINTTMSISVATPLFFGGFTRLAIEHTWFDSTISNSPLVDESRNISARLFFSKFF